MMNLRNILPGFFAMAILISSGCNSDNPFGIDRKPNAIGPTNQVNVVADESLWEGAVGDTFSYYFQSPFPLLPQPEPLFDIQHFEPGSLSLHPARRELRTFVFLVNSSDTNSLTTKLMKRDVGPNTWERITSKPDVHSLIGRDRWAKGQLLIYLFAPSEDELMRTIRQQFNSISQRINSFDQKQVEARLYVQGDNKSLMDSLRKKYGLEIRLPAKFQTALQKKGFTWLRWERRKSSNSLMFYSMPYTDTVQLSPTGLKQLRDSLGKKYIHGGPANSYMVINDQDLPVYYYSRQIDGLYALEARGIWEMHNAFLGGPFVSFLIYDRARGRLVFIDGFVYAPGEEKRDLLQNLVHIIRNIQLPSSG